MMMEMARLLMAVCAVALLLGPRRAAAGITCLKCEYYRTSTIAGAFHDVSGDTEATELTWSEAVEDTCQEVALPWPFPFFAGTYSAVNVNENGYLAFEETPTSYQNKQCPLDNRTFHRIISPMLVDLIADGTTGGGHMHVAKYPTSCPTGNTATGCVIFQWSGVVYDPALTSSGAWQAVLFKTGDIALDYQTVGASLKYTAALMSDLSALDWYSVACNPASAAEGAQPSTRYFFEYDALKDCPNGVCNTGENCITCPDDCPKPCGLCGDGVCDADEDCTSCPSDCGNCCGDGVCSPGECGVCLADCTEPCCGDGVCNTTVGENGCTCPGDCPLMACCGDGICSTALGETCLTCTKDCIGAYCHENDPYTMTQPAPAWLPGADGTDVVELPASNRSSAMAVLPFTFPFYGHFFDWVVVGSRGALWFGADQTSPPVQQCPLVNTGTPYVIAPFWAGLYFSTASSKVLFWNATNCDGAGTSCFAVQYDYMGVTGSAGTARVQAVLYANGIVRFNFNAVPAISAVTVGMKGGTVYSTSFGYNLLYCGGSGTAPTAGSSVVFEFSGCGDGVCSAETENCVTCPIDCPDSPCGVCGDGFCDENETCGVCIADCGKPDTDSDNDGTADCADGCPYDPKKTAPGACGCGKSDVDTDGDGVPDCNDACPTNNKKWLDAGVCGCQAEDKDTDGDGVLDCLDACPLDPNKNITVGWCGCGNPETDTDGDGRPDCADECPNDPDKVARGYCGCGSPETDTDGDGAPDCVDECPDDPAKTSPGYCGCGELETDTDGDGVPDCIDPCPTMYNVTPTRCGCNVTETGDTDGDGVLDCVDECPFDNKKYRAGFCGCGNLETDTDKDGSPDCVDKCPFDPLKNVTGICGCGVPDTDTDGDGVPDCVDECPLDPNVWANATDRDGDGTPDCRDGCPDDPTKVTDVDTDGDGVPDCIDKCPKDKSKSDPLFCGCGAIDPESTEGLVKSPIGLTLDASKRDITCFGARDGSVSAQAAGGTGRYNYKLSCTSASATTTTTLFGIAGNTVKFANNTDGSCTLQVVDGNGCTVVWPVLLTFSTPTVLTITSENAAAGACGADATFVVKASGGLQPYRFSLLGAGYSQTTGSFSGLPAGSYQCRVTDNRGCSVAGAVHVIEQWGSDKCSPASVAQAPHIFILIATAVLALLASHSML